MNNRVRATLLASALILGSSMVGCSGASLDRRPAVSAAHAPATARRIENALAAKDFARALTEAERLIGTAPRNDGYRALLGRAYLANGRYVSAHQAFSEALALGNRDVRTLVSLALMEVATGNSARARDLLARNIDNLPAGDYGLAMAMAGDAGEGVRALLEAVEMKDATAQTRQNLAYAFALGGDWEQARLVAGQDMDASTVQQRLLQWSQAARPGSESLRVAALIGVMPRLDDSGLPARLALGPVSDGVVQHANAGGLVEQAKAEAASSLPAVAAPQQAASEQMASAPASVDAAGGDVTPATLAAAFAPEATPLTVVARKSDAPMRDALKAAFARKSHSNATLVAALPKPVSTEKASDWVVQLGAYDSRAIAVEKWKHISKRRIGLRGYAVVNSTIDLKGRVFHRLAIRGFGDRSGANGLCASMRASGQPCFVRIDDQASAGMMAKAGAANARS